MPRRLGIAESLLAKAHLPLAMSRGLEIREFTNESIDIDLSAIENQWELDVSLSISRRLGISESSQRELDILFSISRRFPIGNRSMGIL